MLILKLYRRLQKVKTIYMYIRQKWLRGVGSNISVAARKPITRKWCIIHLLKIGMILFMTFG